MSKDDDNYNNYNDDGDYNDDDDDDDDDDSHNILNYLVLGSSLLGYLVAQVTSAVKKTYGEEESS